MSVIVKWLRLNKGGISLVISFVAAIIAVLAYLETREQTTISRSEQTPLFIATDQVVYDVQKGRATETELVVRNVGAPAASVNSDVATFIVIECWKDDQSSTVIKPLYGYYTTTNSTANVKGTVALHTGHRNNDLLSALNDSLRVEADSLVGYWLSCFNVVEIEYVDRFGDKQTEYLTVPWQGTGAPLEKDKGEQLVQNWRSLEQHPVVLERSSASQLIELCDQ